MTTSLAPAIRNAKKKVFRKALGTFCSRVFVRVEMAVFTLFILSGWTTVPVCKLMRSMGLPVQPFFGLIPDDDPIPDMAPTDREIRGERDRYRKEMADAAAQAQALGGMTEGNEALAAEHSKRLRQRRFGISTFGPVLAHAAEMKVDPSGEEKKVAASAAGSEVHGVVSRSASVSDSSVSVVSGSSTAKPSSQLGSSLRAVSQAIKTNASRMKHERQEKQVKTAGVAAPGINLDDNDIGVASYGSLTQRVTTAVSETAEEVGSWFTLPSDLRDMMFGKQPAPVDDAVSVGVESDDERERDATTTAGSDEDTETPNLRSGMGYEPPHDEVLRAEEAWVTSRRTAEVAVGRSRALSTLVDDGVRVQQSVSSGDEDGSGSTARERADDTFTGFTRSAERLYNDAV
jgi:hypothetical protein